MVSLCVCSTLINSLSGPSWTRETEWEIYLKTESGKHSCCKHSDMLLCQTSNLQIFIMLFAVWWRMLKQKKFQSASLRARCQVYWLLINLLLFDMSALFEFQLKVHMWAYWRIWIAVECDVDWCYCRIEQKHSRQVSIVISFLSQRSIIVKLFLPIRTLMKNPLISKSVVQLSWSA